MMVMMNISMMTIVMIVIPIMVVKTLDPRFLYIPRILAKSIGKNINPSPIENIYQGQGHVFLAMGGDAVDGADQ